MRTRLGAFLPPAAATANPVDMIATATADDYRRAIRVLAESGAVDALVATFSPPLVTREPWPERPAMASGSSAITVAEALRRGPGWLQPGEVSTLLECYGLQAPAWRTTAPTAAAARSAAHELRGKVAIKALAPGLLHKTDAGAVEVGITTRGAAAAAARITASVERAGYDLEGFLVQSMAPAGVELLAGVVHDPVFGPVLACGSGGTGAELTGDVAVRVTPVTDRDAAEMLESLRSYPLLTGYRGSAPVDVGAVREVVLRLGALVDAHPEIVEVDLNPVIASPGGAVVADARMRVATAPPRQPWPALG